MFVFAWPWMGLFLFLPIAVRYLLPSIKGQIGRAVIRFPHLNKLKEFFGGIQPQNTLTVRFFILTLAMFWICLILALMRPQHVDRMEDIRTEGYDIMLAVDLSGSMRAMDFSKNWAPVSRIDVAKTVVGDFVKARQDDRVGLILFGDFAYQYAPLTLDRESVSQMLNETVISMVGEATAIGDAIGLAVKSLRERPEKSRIIILLTDGEDTASSIPPLQAARLAAQYGIKIHAIGIGSDGLVPFPDQKGRIGMARLELDEELLQQIAGITGGGFFQATDTSALIKVYEKINQMEKTQAETRRYLIRTPLYRYHLVLDLILFGLIALWPLLLQIMGRSRYGV